jgi:hypothetical protein
MRRCGLCIVVAMLCCAWPIPSQGAGGWYLLSPPGTFDDSDPANPVFQIDDKVPMSRWHHVGAYDSAKECEKEKIGLWGGFVRTGKGSPLHCHRRSATEMIVEGLERGEHEQPMGGSHYGPR